MIKGVRHYVLLLFLLNIASKDYFSKISITFLFSETFFQKYGPLYKEKIYQKIDIAFLAIAIYGMMFQ